MKKILLSLPIAAVILLTAFPAMAVVQVPNLTGVVKKTVATTLAQLQTKASKEIDNRITALNDLSSRVDQMKKVSDADKAALKSSIQSVITTINDLKTKITGDTDLTTLKADMQSITKAYRVYALVMPRIRITAAADRVNDLADSINTVYQKLQARIYQLPTGTDTTAIQASMSDITTKVADAQSQAKTASDEVSSLAPDNGNDNLMKANTQALQDARAKIIAAQKDLKAAAADVKSVIKGIKAILKPLSSSTPSPATP